MSKFLCWIGRHHWVLFAETEVVDTDVLWWHCTRCRQVMCSE